VPTKAKSWEPAYSQALNQNKIVTTCMKHVQKHFW